ncbi:beta/alpha barrel domain-containing protein [Streptomyces luteolus]|uniref:Ribulose-phosphate 3-epimerase n=1 Tax=Streptomyces luteolus TaxID=3043615 RepID=A0ABT6SUY1_9ACTN|nr:hypothetical protein [Streptomyces sp. B-S-A12]MDI3418644.1 hypothetical protein [Streptomyces sp. B-S-A12]
MTGLSACTATCPFNTELADRVRNSPGAALAGSLYAVPPQHRPAAAQLLADQQHWVHADVFADRRTGVGVDQIRDLADAGTGPVDVHLLTAGALDALDAVSRPGIARITFPYEGVPDAPAVAETIRASAVSPWLALAPDTSLESCADVLPYVDGLLVMLIEPGTRGSSDPALLGKVRQAAPTTPVGVDGGVGEDNLDRVLAAGATYIVIGRRLFDLTTPSRKEDTP